MKNYLLKNGTVVEYGENYRKEDVIGILLKSGKAISIKTCYSSFSGELLSQDLPTKISSSLAKKDKNGVLNTDRLILFCQETYLLPWVIYLKEYEYLPGVGELFEVFEEWEQINFLRSHLGLATYFPGRYWSSTIYSDNMVWSVMREENHETSSDTITSLTTTMSLFREHIITSRFPVRDVRECNWIIPFINLEQIKTHL